MSAESWDLFAAVIFALALKAAIDEYRDDRRMGLPRWVALLDPDVWGPVAIGAVAIGFMLGVRWAFS